MKIRTNAGEIELTAEMVCRDMVFRLDYTQGLFTLQDEPSVEMRERLAASPHALLGCNPEIASRSDCERFGVHGDAAAHGFARLRDGGAVDLRKRRPRGTVYEMNGARHLATADDGMMLTAGQTFIGLDADLASPEDARHMCCGEVG